MNLQSSPIWLCALTMMAMLAGCDSDIEFIEEPGTNYEPRSFAEFGDQITDLTGEAGDATPTDGSDMPVSGSALYEGAMLVNAGDDALAGRVRLGVDFDDPVSPTYGTVYEIVDEDEERWDGSLELAGGELNRDAGEAASVVAEMSGTITDPSSIDHEVNGRLEGAFSGSDGEFVSGDVIGESCAAECARFEGVFVGKDHR